MPAQSAPQASGGLMVGGALHPAEHRADQLAARALARSNGTSPASLANRDGFTARRLCSNCEEEKNKVSRREADKGSTVAPGVSAVRASPASQRAVSELATGRSLSVSERAFFEPRFGADLSAVRVHEGRQADRAARSMDARAFTLGNDVVFAEGERSNETMAHELAHVVQGNAGIARRAARSPALNATYVANRLRQALGGPGTDEAWVYAALAGRSEPQVRKIAREYHRLFKRSLDADLREDLGASDYARVSGYPKAAGNSAQASSVAAVLQQAMEGGGTDEQALFVALSGRSAGLVRQLRRHYQQQTGRDLLADLRSELSDHEYQQARGLLGLSPIFERRNTELDTPGHDMLDVGNFDFRIAGCRIRVRARLKFEFEDGIPAASKRTFEQRFINVVNTHWDGKAWLQGNAYCPCPTIPISIKALKTTSGNYHKIVDVEKDARRASVISDINVHLNNSDQTIAHEFGHVLGLLDEYDGGPLENAMFWHDAGRHQNERTSLMNNGHQVRDRYFRHYRAQANLLGPPGCHYHVRL